MPLSPPKLLLLALLTTSFGGCGDEPAAAPAAPPEEFDDPFAEEEAGEDGPEPAEPVAAPTAAPGGDSALLAAGDAPSGDPDAPHQPGADGLVAPSEDREQDPPAAEEAGATAEGESPAALAPRKADAPAPKPAAKTSKPAPSSKDAPSTSPPAEAEPAPSEPVAEPSSPEPAPPPTEAKPAPPVVKEPPPPPPEARLVGTYRYAGGSAQRQRLKDAIDVAVGQLNALIRGIGRRRLNESNQIRDQIRISVDGDKVTTTFTPGGTLTTTLGAPAIPWTTDTGNAVKAKAKMVKGRLVQDFTSEDGARRSVYTLDKSGERLTLSVTISSDRLPEPLKYALTYKRK